MLEPIHKYPRTPHLEGSRLQPGDEDLDAVPLATLRGRHVVIEEKLDGANAGISVGDDGRLRLQSRGHVLTGFPWNVVGYALTAPGAFMQSASIFGIYGLAYMVMFWNSP